MCLSLPGRVVDLEGPAALVETAGIRRWCNALLEPDLQLEDRVLVHAAMVVQVVSEEHAQDMELAFAELGAVELRSDEDAVDPPRRT